MGILSNKLISISLVTAMGVMTVGTLAYNLPKNSPNHQIIQKNVELYSNRVEKNENSKVESTQISNNFKNLMQPYVYIKNGQYQIKSTIYQDKNINSSEISQLKLMLRKANEIAIKSHTKNKLNLTQGTQVLAHSLNGNANTSNLISYVGQTKIVYFWWGVYIYLNNVDTMWMEGIGTVAACTALSLLFPGIGGLIASGIASLVATGCGISSPLCQDGCIISYNYAEGPQDIWAQ